MTKVILKAEFDDENGTMELSDEELDNANFVGIVIKDEASEFVTGFDVLVEDLYRVAKMFNGYRLEAKKDYV